MKHTYRLLTILVAIWITPSHSGQKLARGLTQIGTGQITVIGFIQPTEDNKVVEIQGPNHIFTVKRLAFLQSNSLMPEAETKQRTYKISSKALISVRKIKNPESR